MQYLSLVGIACWGSGAQWIEDLDCYFLGAFWEHLIDTNVGNVFFFFYSSLRTRGVVALPPPLPLVLTPAVHVPMHRINKSFNSDPYNDGNTQNMPHIALNWANNFESHHVDHGHYCLTLARPFTNAPWWSKILVTFNRPLAHAVCSAISPSSVCMKLRQRI